MTAWKHKALVVLTGLAHVAGYCAMEVRTAAQDSQPKFVKSAATMEGLCVDIFKAIERTDPDLKFSEVKDFVPLARIEASMSDGSLDAFCGLAKTASRQGMFDFVETPIYTTHSVLAARMDEKADVKNFDDLRKLGEDAIVMVVTKTVHAEVLAAQPGIKVDSGAKDTSINLKKLIEGRGRFVFHNDFALVDEIKRDKLSDKVKLLPAQFVTEGRYFAVSKKAPAGMLQKLNSAVDKLAKSGELAKIFQAYKPK